MSTLNEESKNRQHLQVAKEPSTAYPIVTSTLDEALAETPAQAATSKRATKHTADERLKESGKLERSRHVGRRKARGEQLTVAEDSTTPTVKPVRAKRAQKQLDAEVTAQAEPLSRPKRVSKRDAAKEAATHTATVGEAIDVPPITPSAIEYLGKKNATLADYIKLDPDGLTFVRYHLKRMQQLAAEDLLTSTYSVTEARPISAALQRFSDARAKAPEHNHNAADMQVSANPVEPIDQGNEPPRIL